MHWWVPETCTGHYMPAKISKISISPLLGCYYWLTELIHVSGYLTITTAHTVYLLSSNIVKNSCLQQTTWCVRQPTVVDQQSHLWADWPLTTWWTVGDFCWLYITILLYVSVISRFLCLTNLSVVQRMSSSEVVIFNARHLKQEMNSKCVNYFFPFFLCSCCGYH